MYEHYKDKWLISELVETIGERVGAGGDASGC